MIWQGTVQRRRAGAGERAPIGRRAASAAAATALLAAGLVAAPALDAQAVTPSPVYQQCADSALSIDVVQHDEAAGAGQRLADVVLENTGRSVCRLSGAPTVALVGRGDGTRLGAFADRAEDRAPVTVMLRPGDAAHAALQYTAVTEGGGPFDAACAAARADGYRIAAPHAGRSVFVPAPQWACTTDVHWGLVAAVDATPVGTGAPGRGCRNTAKVPAGAVVGITEDVDQDGRPDTQFFGVRGGTATTGGTSVYGIRTAAGGVYTIADPLKGLGVHSGWTANLDSAGRTITVIDDQRTAKLYAFRSCGFVPVSHRGGGAYEFAIGGRSSSGTGVSCNDRNGGTLLMRAAAKQRSNGRYDVVWTLVSVSASGRTAAQVAGSKEVRWADLKASDPRVAQARTSTCNALLKVEADQD